MIKPILKIVFLLITISSWSQNDKELLEGIKNKSIKSAFQEYLNHKDKTIEFFVANAKPNNGNNIEITNVENIAFYDQVISELKILTDFEEKIYNQVSYKKHQKDLDIVYKRIASIDSIINENYKSRLKIAKIVYQNSSNQADLDVLSTNLTKKLKSDNELFLPTHESCKNLQLAAQDEETCFLNYLRKNLSNHIAGYVEDIDENVNITTLIQFVIEKEGSLAFHKFMISTGTLKIDLMVYKGFRKLAKTAVFSPAKHNEKNVSVYYQLPLKIVLNGQ